MYADAAGVGDWQTVHEGPSSHFVGYSGLEATTRVMKYRPLADNKFELLLEETPFYAESGGQVGDEGEVSCGDLLFSVLDTQKAPIGIVHSAKLVKGTVSAETLNGKATARVDAHKRKLTQSNHTATHLLHAALRGLVSDTIFQAGSQVSPEKLRFDFSYGSGLTEDQIQAVENQVNDQIRASHVVHSHFDVPRDHAVNELGAMAIFGEKYGDSVRVIEIPSESVELCGGTHVTNTSDINLFRITSESGIAAGIRRIEAVTNEAAYQAFDLDRERVRQLALILKSDPTHLIDRATSLLEERAELDKSRERLSLRIAKLESVEILASAEDVGGISVISKTISVDSRDQLVTYAELLQDRAEEGVVLLAAEIENSAALICVVTNSAFKNRKLKAGDLVNLAAKYVDGRGGGRPTLAHAGGNNTAGISEAVSNFSRLVREQLG